MFHNQQIADLIERLLTCMLVALVAGCAPLVQTSRCDAIASGASSAERSACSVPRFSEGGPNAEDYSASKGYPIGDRSTWHRTPFLVGSHSHLDQIFEGRTVPAGSVPSSLKRAAAEPVLRYEYEGQSRTLDDYLARNPATGLLVAQGDTILFERYQYARTDQHRFASWSMAKTVTAMLVGIAIAEGHIRSIDDHAAVYVPALASTEYGRTSVSHLLQMSSGVQFVEDYSTSGSDSMRLVE
jgi:CubicO group peptidase (beta-lactamase class C family)